MISTQRIVFLIVLYGGVKSLTVPKGFKYLGASGKDAYLREGLTDYFLSDDAVNWNTAFVRCPESMLGGNLLALRTEAELTTVRNAIILNFPLPATVWTSGMHDGMNWVWATAEELNITTQWWDVGFPNPNPVDEYVVLNVRGPLNSQRKLRTCNKEDRYKFICEAIRDGTPPSTTTTVGTTIEPPTTESPTNPPTTELPVRAKDCAELQLKGKRQSGIYTIFPFFNEPERSIEVQCDLETNGGGWTVFQRRGSFGVPAENFYRDWISYENGFGSLKAEFWLGLMSLAALTKSEDQTLRIEMMDWEGISKEANYASFRISDATEMYRLHVSNYSGTAGDSLTGHDNSSFTTLDKDNDYYPTGNCAQIYKGGWWYTICHTSNLNGVYVEGGNHETYAIGINWKAWHGYHYGLKQVDMKIRPRNFI